jgi:hypothetical protein
MINTKKFNTWITLPKNIFTENFWPKGHLTETPFNRTPFDRKYIWPKYIWRIAVQSKVVWPKVHFTEKSHLAEKKIYQKVVWPKIFFDRKFNLKN